MDSPTISLVVPTIREKCINDFLSQWESNTCVHNLIVVEDNPTRTFNLPGIKHHYSWKEIKEVMGDDAWIISRRDSAIKCFGFIIAHRLRSDYTFVLDDDCYPIGNPDDFFRAHYNTFHSHSRWTFVIPGIRTRGTPYANVGRLPNVVMNVGLWKGNLDLDAPHALVSPVNDSVLPRGNRVLPKHQYAALCGMNLCFNSRVAPLTYFPLMGEGQPFRRFDDIWFGIIAKKICDHLNLSIAIGEPFINHAKASNLFDNLVKEAPGIKFNENFWMTVDAIALTKTSPKECMLEVGESLALYEGEHQEYVNTLGAAIRVWCKYFTESETTP